MSVTSIHTTQKYDFPQSSANLSLYQKEVYSAGVNLFNSLPQTIKRLSDNPKQFKLTLKFIYIVISSTRWTDILM